MREVILFIEDRDNMVAVTNVSWETPPAVVMFEGRPYVLENGEARPPTYREPTWTVAE